MTVHRLAATGVDNWDTPLVTYGDVWNDNSDATYGPLSYFDGTKVNVRGYLAAYSGETVASITLHFRASASGDVTDQPIAFEFDRDTGGRVLMFYGGSSLGRNSDSHFFGPGATFAIPTDGVTREYTAVVDPHTLAESGWDDLDELLGDLQSGTGWLYAWSDDYLAQPPSPAGSVRIYEAWLEVATVEVDPTAPAPPAPGGSQGSPGGAPAPDAGPPEAPVAPGTARADGFLSTGARRGAPTGLEVVVAGQWLSLRGLWGDLTYSTIWPGGSANASWTASRMPRALIRRDLPVQIMYAGEPLWSGVLDLPQGDGQMNAVGLFALGQRFSALDGDGLATTVPDDAIDAAISRGLRWKRRVSFSADPQDIDTSSGPVTLGALLDACATDARSRWAVDPYGYVFMAADPTTPAAQVLDLDGPLSLADDDVATALIGRYRTSSGYATTPPVVGAAESWLGYSEDTVDLTGRGVLTEVKAVDKLQALLDLGRALPAWADPIQLGYGDLFTAGQVPVEPSTVAAGLVVRVQNQLDDTRSLGGTPWADVLVGQTEWSEGSVTLTPIGAPVFGLYDAITQLQNRRSA